MCNIEEHYLDNLGHKIVAEEIEDALALYSESSSQTVFAIPELREKLSTYVLSKILLPHRVLEAGKDFRIKPKFPYRSLELRLIIEEQVHQGIQAILTSDFDLLSDDLSLNQYPDVHFHNEIEFTRYIRDL